MAISRMNMERQLRAGGGIMSLDEPRQGYFLGKLVRKAKKTAKKVFKSPLGKAALLGGAAFGIPGTTFGGLFGRAALGGGATGLLGTKGIAPFATKMFGTGTKLQSIGDIFRKGGEAGADVSALRLLGGLGIGSAIAAPFLMGGDEEEIDEGIDFAGIQPMVADIRNQAKAYYRDPTNSALYFMPPKSAVQSSFYAAGGGLANIDMPKRGMVDGPGSYAGLKNIFVTPGGDTERMPPGKFDFLTETGPISDRAKEILSNMSEEDIKELEEQGTLFDFIENIIKTPFMIRGGDTEYKAYGGRIGKADGGIMDLGGLEKDYREGGFVPLGAEERADDVPARLSKNEFVFTADAVRNAGGGDIDKGAEAMQNMMDNLESGGTISEESQGEENPAQAMFDQAQMLESRIE